MKLYKFRNINSEKDYKRVLEYIEEKFLHAAKIANFPDTFELDICKIEIKYDENDIDNLMKYNLKQLNKPIPDKKTLAQILTDNPSSEYYRFELTNLINELKEIVNICSLSKSYNDSKMWEDYSKGICIEVEVMKHKNIKERHVKYTNEKPIIKLPKDIFNTELLKEKLLQYKSESYKFENEVRFVSDKQNKLPLENISKIYVGYNVSKWDKDKLVKNVHNIDPNIKIYEIIKDKEYYKFIEGDELI
ncbi:MAG TPA: hypothetical protein PLH46_03900 [Caldisericia bacterium]|nr:hypothetical protein [Methanofastidiosum sp.]HQJ56769.1 hypothetical protein [Caldisericia bacterium]